MLEKRKANTDTAYFTTKIVKNKRNIAHSAKSREWRSISFVMFLILSCNTPNKYEYNENFSIVCARGFDTINLKNKTFTREYLKGERTVSFDILEKDKYYLFDLLQQKEIWTIKDSDLEDTCKHWVEPSISTRLEVWMTDKETFDFYWERSLCSIPRINDLEYFVKEFYKIIEKDRRVRKLDRTDILLE